MLHEEVPISFFEKLFSFMVEPGSAPLEICKARLLKDCLVRGRGQIVIIETKFGPISILDMVGNRSSFRPWRSRRLPETVLGIGGIFIDRVGRIIVDSD